MADYYSEKLSADRLRRCYEIAPLKVKLYLQSEIDFVLTHLQPGDRVLELGCGYGRILPDLARKANSVIGIDTSLESLLLGKEILSDVSNYSFISMDAVQLSFQDCAFDCVVCIQNGISSFHVERDELISESIRVTKSGGTVLFSSYSDNFWDDRLRWFKLQSEEGLLGEIDYERTKRGKIVCKDGFTADTVSPDEFLSLISNFDVGAEIVEVDESSLFCVITPY